MDGGSEKEWGMYEDTQLEGGEGGKCTVRSSDLTTKRQRRDGKPISKTKSIQLADAYKRGGARGL